MAASNVQKNASGRLDEAREKVYRLICGQLFYDGHQTAAKMLGSVLDPAPPSIPSDRLNNLVALARRVEDAKSDKPSDDPVILGLDLDFGTDSRTHVPEPHSYQLTHVSLFQAPCLVSKFSRCGKYAALGCKDGTAKVLSVHRMAFQDQEDVRVSGNAEKEIPLLRTLSDHSDAVQTLDFHPHEDIVMTGSADETVKFYNFSKPAVKRATRTLQEYSSINSVAFHPTGDFFVLGASDNGVRLYNTETVQCYSTKVEAEEHAGSVTSVAYSQNGRMFSSCSEDGEVKVWDGVTNRLAQTFSRAHGGRACSSVAFSRNSKYLLSTGVDGHARLWELAMGRCIHTYVIPSQKIENKCCATFNHTEDFVLLPEEKPMGNLGVFNAKTAETIRRTLPLCHSGTMTDICHSPTIPAFISCAEEGRAKFWFKNTP